jgi:hypothetical protein
MKICSKILELLHAGRKTDRQTDMTELRHTFFLLFLANMANKKTLNREFNHNKTPEEIIWHLYTHFTIFDHPSHGKEHSKKF